MKREYWIGAGVLALLVLGYLFLPLGRAYARYQMASDGSLEACEASYDIAREWSELGVSSKREQWAGRAGLECLHHERLQAER